MLDLWEAIRVVECIYNNLSCCHKSSVDCQSIHQPRLALKSAFSDVYGQDYSPNSSTSWNHSPGVQTGLFVPWKGRTHDTFRNESSGPKNCGMAVTVGSEIFVMLYIWSPLSAATCAINLKPRLAYFAKCGMDFRFLVSRTPVLRRTELIRWYLILFSLTYVLQSESWVETNDIICAYEVH